jgi:hypothetical protein
LFPDDWAGERRDQQDGARIPDQPSDENLCDRIFSIHFGNFGRTVRVGDVGIRQASRAIPAPSSRRVDVEEGSLPAKRKAGIDMAGRGSNGALWPSPARVTVADLL